MFWSRRTPLILWQYRLTSPYHPNQQTLLSSGWICLKRMRDYRRDHQLNDVSCCVYTGKQLPYTVTIKSGVIWQLSVATTVKTKHLRKHLSRLERIPHWYPFLILASLLLSAKMTQVFIFWFLRILRNLCRYNFLYKSFLE